MKRKILLILSLFLAVTIYADITPTENQIWWGYFNASDASKLPYSGNLGYSQSCTIDAAIRIPASEEIVSGSTIKAIRFWLGTDISAISSSVKVWISTKQPTGSITQADYRQEIAKANVVAKLNEVELTTPFEVNNRDIYVGYTFTINAKSYPVMSYGDDVPDGFYYRVNNGAWNDFYGTGYGRLALQVLVEAESFPTNCVKVADFGQNMVLKERSVTIPITIMNKGVNVIKSIAYTVSTEGGETSAETTKNFGTSTMAVGSSKTFNISFHADEEARKYKKYFTVTKVNGEDNTASENSGTGFLITMANKQPVTPTIEEFTGTWCGWCPRGTVGMEKIHQYYGDKVVQIAAHSGDPMEISAYSAVINAYANGYPTSTLDRQKTVDPSYSELKAAVTTALKRVTPGLIGLSAMWDSDDKKAVIFNTKTQFSYSEEDCQFTIAYVLVEDGLTGTGSDWAQSNYYSGNGSGDMAWWGKQGSPVTGLEYNHVAVAAWEAKNGVKGSVNPIVEEGVDQEYSFTGDISKNNLIQDKSKLTAIALLIDPTTGNVLNAAKSAIADFATDIQPVTFDNALSSDEWFDLSGRKLQTSQKGINIIRMNDGTVKKVLFK